MMDARRFAGKNPLAVAFLISLLIHLLLAGGWQLGQKLHWWDHQATWLMNMQKKHAAKVLARNQPNRPDEPPKPKEIPLRFIEVDPAQAQTEAPKDAKYYSSLNSKAANPDATVAADVPSYLYILFMTITIECFFYLSILQAILLYVCREVFIS